MRSPIGFCSFSASAELLAPALGSDCACAWTDKNDAAIAAITSAFDVTFAAPCGNGPVPWPQRGRAALNSQHSANSLG